MIPYATGLAINDVLNSKVLGLIGYVSLWIIHGLTHIIRQRYNIRTYSKIYRDVVTNVVIEQKERGVEASKIIARSSLSREFVDFFERNIPIIINTMFKSLGALMMLIMYDWLMVILCLALLLPLYILNRRYSKKSLDLNSKLNDQYEKEVNILTINNPLEVWDHYTSLTKWKIKLIDTQVINWGIMELFVIMLVSLVIFRAGSLKLFEAGAIYSIISYIWNFIFSLDQVPSLVQQVSRLRDIKEKM